MNWVCQRNEAATIERSRNFAYLHCISPLVGRVPVALIDSRW